MFCSHLHLGHLADAFFQSDLQICQKKVQQYIAVGTVRISQVSSMPIAKLTHC